MTESEALEILKRDDDEMRKGYFCINDFLALEVAKKALEKQIAKKVNLYIGEVPSCPVCNTRLRGYEGFIIAYCKGCGQLLKGEGVNDD